MKALTTNRQTIVLSRSRRVFMALILAGMIGLGLAALQHPNTPALLPGVSVSRNSYTPLDQHERHPAGFPTIYTPLDQHERHAAGFANSYTPLDQHERQSAGFPTIYTPLDQHERHAATGPRRSEFDPATQSVIDYLRAHARVEQTPALDPATQSVIDYLRVHARVEQTPALDPATQSVIDYLRAHARVAQ